MTTANPNLKGSELAGVVGTIDPDAYAVGTEVSDWVDMADYELLLATILVGAITATGTVDAKLEQATDGSGTGAKDITGKSITQLTAAGGDSDSQVLIDCRRNELDVDNDFTHVRLSMTFAVAGADAGAVLHGLAPRYGYAQESDLASVVEIV